MTKLTTLGLVAASCFGLAACASGPKLGDVSNTLSKPPAGDGRIYVYRTQVFGGAAVQPTIYIAGQKASTCVPNGVFIADIPAGSYDAAAQTETESRVHFSIVPGEEKYLRCQIGMGVFIGEPKLDLIDPTEGHADVQALSFTGQEVITPPPAPAPPPPPAAGAPTS